MPADLSKRFEFECAKLKFNGNEKLARKWLDWEKANQPRLRDHFVRLWRCLRKGRLPPEERGYG